MEEQVSIETSLVNSIISDNLKDIVIDSAELSLDQFLDDGLLKDIPFFGTFYKGVKTFLGIREAIFSKKVYGFLKQIKDIPQIDRIAFINEIEQNAKEKNRVGQRLILILDQLDDLSKPEIIGNLFCAVIRKEISYQEFVRLSSIVQRAFLPDLIALKKDPWLHSISISNQEYLSSIGIMTFGIVEDESDRVRLQMLWGGNESEDVKQKISYTLNAWGVKLLDFGIRE